LVKLKFVLVEFKMVLHVILDVFIKGFYARVRVRVRVLRPRQVGHGKIAP